MADPVGGKGSADFRREAQVGGLKRNGSANGADPLREAIAARKEILGLQVLERSVRVEEQETTAAEVEKLKLQIERQRLLQEAAAAGNANAGAIPDAEWREFLVSEVKTLRENLQVSAEKASAAERAVMQTQLGMMQEELGRMAANRPPTAADQIAEVKATVEQFKALNDLLSPPAKEPRIPPGDTPELRAWTMRVELDHQRWAGDREDRHKERMEALRLEAEHRRVELSLAEADVQLKSRFVEQTVPRILEVFEPLVQRFMTGFMEPTGGVPTPTAAASAPPVSSSRASTRPAALPAGVESTDCAQCHRPIFYRKGWKGVICQSCGAEYSWSDDPPAATSAYATGGTVETVYGDVVVSEDEGEAPL